MPSQIDRWQGEFGTAYIERNEATDGTFRRRRARGGVSYPT